MYFNTDLGLPFSASILCYNALYVVQHALWQYNLWTLTLDFRRLRLHTRSLHPQNVFISRCCCVVYLVLISLLVERTYLHVHVAVWMCVCVCVAHSSLVQLVEMLGKLWCGVHTKWEHFFVELVAGVVARVVAFMWWRLWPFDLCYMYRTSPVTCRWFWRMEGPQFNLMVLVQRWPFYVLYNMKMRENVVWGMQLYCV